MARSSKVDACMFCGKVPCECNSPSKTQKKKTVGRKIEVAPAPILEPVKPKVSMVEAMRAAAANAPKMQMPVTKKSYPQPVDNKPVIEDTEITDLLFADALRNLAPILHPDELEKYRMQITSKPTALERARIWRARRYG